MSRARKAILVAIGYAGAVLAAWIVLRLHVLATDIPERESAGGMYAFGDTVVFVGAFAPLRILPAPILGLGFFLALLLAPTRSSRRLLTAATAMEVGAFGAVALRWLSTP